MSLTTFSTIGAFSGRAGFGFTGTLAGTTVGLGFTAGPLPTFSNPFPNFVVTGLSILGCDLVNPPTATGGLFS